MAQIRIGKTDIITEQNAFGALPIQRIEKKDAAYLLHKAYDGGMTYFDTARAYSDSEEKLGEAFHGMWDKVFVATKSMSVSTKGVIEDLETSLRNLRTDVIDVFQFHNPAFCPTPGDESRIYDAALKAKEQGKIRYIGITNHRLDVAKEAINSELYATLEFPFSYLSTDKELELVKLCEEKNMGFIAMKALSGGLLTNSRAACAWIMQYKNVLPIWGIQKEHELDEFLSYIPTPPPLTDELKAFIEKDVSQLQGEFCRGCGYCMPCPQGIEINTCARASLLLRRSPSANLLSPEGKAKMDKIEECIECRQCAEKCPYGLDTPNLLKRNLKDYKEVLAGKEI